VFPLPTSGNSLNRRGDVTSLVVAPPRTATMATVIRPLLLPASTSTLTPQLRPTPLRVEPTQQAAMVCGDIALTSTRLPDGTVTAEVARRQSDGTWLWVIDRFSISPEAANPEPLDNPARRPD
jgi:hypothetical protein